MTATKQTVADNYNHKLSPRVRELLQKQPNIDPDDAVKLLQSEGFTQNEVQIKQSVYQMRNTLNKNTNGHGKRGRKPNATPAPAVLATDADDIISTLQTLKTAVKVAGGKTQLKALRDFVVKLGDKFNPLLDLVNTTDDNATDE